MKSANTTAIVTAFGVATATMSISPSAEASIINLTVNPGSNAFKTVVSALSRIELAAGASIVGSFSQFNDVMGRTITTVSSGLFNLGFRRATLSETVNVGQTFETWWPLMGPGMEGDSTFLGILTNTGKVGWLHMEYEGGTIKYTAALEDTDRSIHVGSRAPLSPPVDVPAPGTLALSALGLLAAGAVRKRRWKHAKLLA